MTNNFTHLYFMRMISTIFFLMIVNWIIESHRSQDQIDRICIPHSETLTKWRKKVRHVCCQFVSVFDSIMWFEWIFISSSSHEKMKLWQIKCIKPFFKIHKHTHAQKKIGNSVVNDATKIIKNSALYFFKQNSTHKEPYCIEFKSSKIQNPVEWHLPENVFIHRKVFSNWYTDCFFFLIFFF